jgi:hypothetical protein
MKYQLLFFFLAMCCFSSCDKDEPATFTNDALSYPPAGLVDNDLTNDALSYPPAGLVDNDLTSENDCNLPECSDERVVRFLANEMQGELYKDENNDFKVRYTGGIDTSFELYFCDLPEAFREEGLLVNFDGQIIDACGVKNPILGGQSIYFVKLTRIERQQ